MLTGRTVLIVETEFIIALGLQSALEGAGADNVVLATTADDARHQQAEWADAALAVIEFETHKPDLMALAAEIAGRGIPVIGISADMRLASGMPGLPGAPILIKPILDGDLLTSVQRARSRDCPT